MAYNHGEYLEMKCSDPNLVADIPGYTKETFGVRCGNLKIDPTFETPPPNKWPRCIPRTCVKYLNGTLWDVENKKTLQVCFREEVGIFIFAGIFQKVAECYILTNFIKIEFSLGLVLQNFSKNTCK